MLEASSIDAQSHLHELPVKSRFDQVRRASGFDGLNLLKSPFELSLRRGGCCICGGERLALAA